MGRRSCFQLGRHAIGRKRVVVGREFGWRWVFVGRNAIARKWFSQQRHARGGSNAWDGHVRDACSIINVRGALHDANAGDIGTYDANASNVERWPSTRI